MRSPPPGTLRVSPLTKITIGDWTVRPSLNLVERDGASIKLEPRAMDLLVYLVNARDRVVSPDELLRHVWQGRVFDGGIVYKRINQLRNALGDGTRGSRFIETIPKRGYRLIAPVIVEDANEPSSSLVEPVREHRAPPAAAPTNGSASQLVSRKLRPWLAAVGVAVLLIAGLGAMRLRDLAGGSAASDAFRTSVAVLPFVSINGPDDEYFSDGLTEELLNRLSGVAELRVPARTSSFYFKGRNETLQTIGRLLDVRYVMTAASAARAIGCA